MRRNARKLKPNPSDNLRRNSSIRSIIGDRRFNDHFGHVNTNETEGAVKIKRMKVGDAEGHDLSNLGRITSSDHSEPSGDPKGFVRDSAAKTSEYAFFKRMKENSCSNVQVNANYHDNQLNSVQQSDHFTREETQNVQKENVKHATYSIPSEKEQGEARYSFLSPPCCGSKNSAVSNVFGADGTNVQNVKPNEYNWLSPSVGSKTKNSGNKGVFAAKREKLRHLAAERSSYSVNELSSEGFDLVSALISRILPVVHDDNSYRDQNQIESDSSYKLPYFSDSELAPQIKSHETYRGKLIKFRDLSYLDDGFTGSTEKPIDKNLLEWNPLGSESFSGAQLSYSSIQYNHCHPEDYSGNFIKSLDDGFSGSTKKPIDKKNLLKWNPSSSESFSHGQLINSSIQYNHRQTEDYSRNFIDSDHISYLDDCFFRSTRKPIEWNPTGLKSCMQYDLAGGFRIQNFDMERMLTFDEPLSIHDSRNFQELEESHFYNEPKLLEQPQKPLLLGWDCNSEKDESFLTSSASPNSSPYITRRPKERHLLTSSISPYTPKHHLMAVEDCSIKFPLQDYTFEHHGSEPFLFLIESPARKSLSFLNTGLGSIVDDDDGTEENFVYSSDMLLKGRESDYFYMESFVDRRFDHIDYPFLLHDSSRDDGF